MKIRLITAFGLEGILSRELQDIGITEKVVENGYITIEGDMHTVAMCNIMLRTCERVLIELSSFEVRSFEDLFQGILNTNIKEFINKDDFIAIKPTSVKSVVYSLKDIQKVGKKAFLTNMEKVYNTDKFDETGNRVQIRISILKDNCSILLDTSGSGNHKRGYRESQSDAPLKETLAAAIVLISRYKGDRPLIDPMCGGATILIEAAMIAKNIAPGLNRDFLIEEYSIEYKKIFDNVRKQARSNIDNEKELNIQGYDCDRYVIKSALINIKNAGLENDIHVQVRDLEDFSINKSHGHVITNPPYAIRIGDEEEVEKIHQELGKIYKSLDGWRFYVITPADNFERDFGKKATKNRKLYNGRIKCYFYQYFR